MRVIVAGSRSLKDQSIMDEAIRSSPFTISEVVSGTASGADSMGEDWATRHNIPVKRFPADWKNMDLPGAVPRKNNHGTYNATAGHYRNQQMADYVTPDGGLIVAWDGVSKGTADMVKRAHKSGLKIHIFLYESQT